MVMAGTVAQDTYFVQQTFWGFQHYHKETLWIFPCANTPEHKCCGRSITTSVPFDLIGSYAHALDAEDLHQ